jgi:hypothetical protein
VIVTRTWVSAGRAVAAVREPLPASERKTLEGAQGQMAQGNVISGSSRTPLHPFLFPCSISLSPMTAPAVAERRIRHTMQRAERTRTEADARRSALITSLTPKNVVSVH